MFLGHYAAAMAAKKFAPKTSLGVLFMAAQFIDLIWPILLIFGVEAVSIEPGNTKMTPLNFYHYPYTHSLLAVVIWAIVFGGVYFIFKKDKRAALVCGALVLSHWVLDLIVHRPDLPLTLNESRLAGFGVWNSMPLTLILELGLFAVGVWIYVKNNPARDKTGKYAFWSLAVLLAAIYVMNLNGVPPNTKILAYTALAAWIFVPWAHWADSHR